MKIFQWIGGLLLPMFRRPRVSPGVIWFLHLLLVAGIAVGLWYLGRRIDIGKFLDGWPMLKQVWLSLLFLLFYFVIWQTWWVLKLLRPEAMGSDFPDIDQAWNQICESLEKAGIGLADTPVFLVFGRVAGLTEAIFQGVPGGLAVTGGSPSGSPVRAFANRDAIFVTCPGASGLGNPGRIQQESAPVGGGGFDMGASIGAGAMGGGGGGGFSAGDSIGMEKSIGMGGSVGGNIGRVQEIIRRAQMENRSLSDAERDEIRRLSGGGAPAAMVQKAGKTSLVQDPAEAERRQARLAHFCGLIARSRWPLTPINGSFVYATLGDCEREEVGQQMGLIARQDLQTATETFGLTFPVYTLFGGIEDLNGGSEFLLKFAPNRQGQRLGKGFPLVPDVPYEQVGEQAEKAALWVFHSLLPYWVFKSFGVERSGDSAAMSTRQNSELFDFLNAIRSRGAAASRLVSRLAMPGDDGPVRFGGAYLTAQAPELGGPLFLDEFYKKLFSTQGLVEWTDAAFAADAGYRSSTKMGYAFLVVVVLVTIGFGVFVGMKLSNS